MINNAVLVPEGYYHVFNRAVGREKIFVREENYYYFLGLFRKYIAPLSEIFSFCLLPDRFDFFIRIKDEEAIWHHMKKLKYRHLQEEEIVTVFLLQQFSNFFNAYTKAFNKKYRRKGRLFMESFKRRSLAYPEHFTSLIYDMHMKPVQRRLCHSAHEWLHSSHNGIRGNAHNWLYVEKVLEWFGSLAEYEAWHEQSQEKNP